jgi:hypothetical protein
MVKMMFAMNLVYNKVVDNSLYLVCVKFSWHLAKWFVSYGCSKLVFRTSWSLEFLDQI